MRPEVARLLREEADRVGYASSTPWHSKPAPELERGFSGFRRWVEAKVREDTTPEKPLALALTV